MGKKDRPFNNPFFEVGKQLKKELKAQNKAEKKAAAQPKGPRVKVAPELSEADMFLQAMHGTERLNDPRGVTPAPLPPPNAKHVPFIDEDEEVRLELASLVDGTGHFDITDSDEFIEGCVESLDRRILSRLKRGDFAHQSHLDLHGYTRVEARLEVEQFITNKRTAGHRCVLIVHGRGLNSKDQIPVLKSALKNWLERGRIGRSVLAFCTARPHDGGAGAVYVLLRRPSPGHQPP